MAEPRRKEITSTKSPYVQRFRDAGGGEPRGVVLVEGARLLGEALDAGLRVEVAAVSPRLRDDGPHAALRDRLAKAARELLDCTDEVLERMSGVETHQGCAAICALPERKPDELLRGDLSPLVVAAAGVRDPGNLGSLLRTAEAAGATGVIAMAGGAHPFRDKAVRGSMGSLFRLPVLHGMAAADVIAFARSQKLQLAVADGAGDTDHHAADLRRPTLLVLGGEAAGPGTELLQAADVRLRIDMNPKVESLNVAVAAGVLLFEARRQRR